MSNNQAAPDARKPSLTAILGLDPASIQHRRIADDLQINPNRRKDHKPADQATTEQIIQFWYKNGYAVSPGRNPALFVANPPAPAPIPETSVQRANRIITQLNEASSRLTVAMARFQRRANIVVGITMAVGIATGVIMGHYWR
jgi:hypothetical protein